MFVGDSGHKGVVFGVEIEEAGTEVLLVGGDGAEEVEERWGGELEGWFHGVWVGD